MLLTPITANADNSANNNNSKSVSNAGLRSDGELVQGKKPMNQLRREAGQAKQQQGRVLTDSDVNEARQERNHNIDSKTRR